MAIVSERASLRTQRVEIRVTPDEAEELAQRAHAAGCRTVSEYIRTRTLENDDAPRSRRISPVQRHAELIRTLSRIGDGLNRAIEHASDSPARVELEVCRAALCDALLMLG